MARYPPPFRLFLTYLPGCEVCAVVKPVMLAWAARRPWLKYRELDMTVIRWRADRWVPVKVPTLIVLRPDGAVLYKSLGDDLTAEDIRATTADAVDDWLRRVAPAALETPR